jgi:hypothetical protein
VCGTSQPGVSCAVCMCVCIRHVGMGVLYVCMHALCMYVWVVCVCMYALCACMCDAHVCVGGPCTYVCIMHVCVDGLRKYS